MRIRNSTCYNVDALLEKALSGYPHDQLDVEIKYCPKGSKRIISGTYYRQTNGYDDGKLIRVRINRNNRYPITISFKTSEYYTKRDAKGREIIYQKMRRETFTSPEHLITAIFLHEFSHYLDHIEGKNGRYKQTKADKFAVARLEDLGIVRRREGG